MRDQERSSSSSPPKPSALTPRNRFEKIVREAFERSDVRIGGTRPWDIQVHDERLYERLFRDRDLAFGESYVDGWWDCEQLDEMTFKLTRASSTDGFQRRLWTIALAVYAKAVNLGRRSDSARLGPTHYDFGNELFERMLDKRMIYSCGYWKNAQTLDDAQEAKLELCCQKLELKPGMKVLDIGCGWGGFLQYAAEKYKIEGVGITVSREQLSVARSRCQGLPVEIRLQDYRDVTGEFDAIVSIGMFEHVCVPNHRTYMDVVASRLKDDGLTLLHTIGSEWGTSPWLKKHIFAVGDMPSSAQIAAAASGRLVIEDWHNFGPYYDRTLRAWEANFTRRWDEIKSRYDDRFKRLWRYYLLAGAGLFRARSHQLWQIVLSKRGLVGGYSRHS
jgi:cyclopropane-fatty-acyl-phospholipid synthase